ncbi:MAG: MerR family transcriptional regulator [Bacteroidia bacterium]|nr:MerR family transcriptional regulator [Bacteroidia bacterium]NNM15313.1 MerR family transcriptional regulator [Bacteroidia bacterium]
MNRFSIKDIETLTGIKAHTLRIWEQRFDMVEPKRTDTNIRYYDNEDLKYLLNVSLLSKMGYKISKISELNDKQIYDIIDDYSSSKSDCQDKLNNLLRCTLELDETAFEKIISTEILENGIIRTMIGLIFPFLSHMGNLWAAGSINPSYEHFIINLIKTKLLVAIDGLGYSVSPKAKKKVLLFLPEGENHEIGLLFANYVFKHFKHQTLYLGQNLPCSELEPVIKNYKPEIIFTSMVSGHTKEKMLGMINIITTLSAKSDVLVSGSCFLNADLKYPKRVYPITSYESMKRHL